MQAGGHRFESVHLHHPAFGEDHETPSGATRAGCCLKGEERVCHVTEADAPGANALDVSEEVSSCEAAGMWGLAPVRGGFVRRNSWVKLWSFALDQA